jgi:hypothetical protein
MAMFKLRDLVSPRAKQAEPHPAESEQAANLSRRISKLLNTNKAPSAIAERTIETRHEERFVPQWTSTSFTLKNGKRYDARIMNMSRFGVALDADFSNIPVKDITFVGKHAVTHIRSLRPGAVFKFKIPLEDKQCNSSIIL